MCSVSCCRQSKKEIIALSKLVCPKANSLKLPFVYLWERERGTKFESVSEGALNWWCFDFLLIPAPPPPPVLQIVTGLATDIFNPWIATQRYDSESKEPKSVWWSRLSNNALSAAHSTSGRDLPPKRKVHLLGHLLQQQRCLSPRSIDFSPVDLYIHTTMSYNNNNNNSKKKKKKFFILKSLKNYFKSFLHFE